MATICAYLENAGRVWIGTADGMVVDGVRRNHPRPKWVQLGSWWYGIADNQRSLDYVREYARSSSLRRGVGAENAWEVMMRVRNHDEQHPDDPPFNPTGLIVYPNGLWFAESDFTTSHEGRGDLIASGSGAPYAMAAARALRQHVPDIGAEDLVRAALQAAADFDPLSNGLAKVRLIPREEHQVYLGSGIANATSAIDVGA